MVALKSNQIASFLRAPDKAIGAVLFYGPDAGLVAERGLQLAKTLAARENPPGEIQRMEDADLESDPDRLAIDLQMVSMFGGRKIIRATPGRRLNTNVLKPLVERGDLTGFLIVEAGNLRPDEALRQLFDRAKQAVAIPCYPDEARDLDAVIRDVLSAHGMTIGNDARELLVARLGADRVMSRGEVEKLALYAMGRNAIEPNDVEAVVGDASELAMDRVIQRVISGASAAAIAECDRAVAAGESPQAILLILQRQLLLLHRVRCAMDAGRSLDDAVRGIRPPLHFRAKDAVAAGARNWTAGKLEEALAIVARAARAARLSGSLETVLVERTLAEVAGLVARAPSRR